MRKPRNSHELFHYWANNVLPSARCGNVRYDRGVLYSYSVPIARIVGNVALFHTGKWSVTTSSHRSAARGAWSGFFLNVPHIATAIDANADDGLLREIWERKIRDAYIELRAHPRRKASIGQRIASLALQYHAYSYHFTLSWPDITDDQIAEWVEQHERAVAAQEAMIAEIAEWVEQHERAVAAQEAMIAEIAARREKEEALELELWRNHDGPEHQRFAKTALRLSHDGTKIETTRGAAVPVAVARPLWALACRQRRENLGHRLGNPFPVGPYNLDSIGADGSLRVGCHTIPFDELELMAKKLGLVDSTPSPGTMANREEESHV